MTKNVVFTTSGTNLFQNCCILGYHGTFPAVPNIQVYSPFCLDTTGIFGPGYTSTLSHEMGEAVNDPTGRQPDSALGEHRTDRGVLPGQLRSG